MTFQIGADANSWQLQSENILGSAKSREPFANMLLWVLAWVSRNTAGCLRPWDGLHVSTAVYRPADWHLLSAVTLQRQRGVVVIREEAEQDQGPGPLQNLASLSPYLVIHWVSGLFIWTEMRSWHSSGTHHIDGIHWTDAVDKHVRVNHRRLDWKKHRK